MKQIIILIVFISCTNGEKKSPLAPNKVSEQTVKKERSYENKIDLREYQSFEKQLDTLPPEKINRTLDRYKKNVKMFSLDKFKDNLLAAEEIITVTPMTQEEFIFYYSLTYSSDEDQNLHDAITTSIINRALEDDGDLLFFYANMAQFVDGEYGESYMIYIEDIAKNNKTKFCAIYKYLSKKSKLLLETLNIPSEVCK